MLSSAKLALPGSQERVDVTALAVGERRPRDQAAHLLDVPCLDRRLEVLALGRRLPKLASRPASEPNRSRRQLARPHAPSTRRRYHGRRAGSTGLAARLAAVTTRRLIVLAGLAAAVGTTAAVGGGLVLAEGEDGRAATRAGGTVDVRSHAPPLRGTDPVTGARVALSNVEGKPVVVHVWASWCRTCASGAQAMQRFVHHHRKDVRVLGLDYQDDPEDAKAFYDVHGWTFRSVSDPDGRRTARFGIENVPATIVLDEDHLVVRTLNGPATTTKLEAALAAAQGGAK